MEIRKYHSDPKKRLKDRKIQLQASKNPIKLVNWTYRWSTGLNLKENITTQIGHTEKFLDYKMLTNVKNNFHFLVNFDTEK